MSTFLLGFCAGLATMVGVSVALGVIMLLKARDADDTSASRRRSEVWRIPLAGRHPGT